MIDRIWRIFFGEPLPVIKTLPDHVKNVKLDIDLLRLAMEHTHMPNPAVNPNRFTVPKS